MTEHLRSRTYNQNYNNDSSLLSNSTKLLLILWEFLSNPTYTYGWSVIETENESKEEGRYKHTQQTTSADKSKANRCVTSN